MRLDPSQAFVLLDNARDPGVPARLYRDPVAIVRADGVADVAAALDRLRTARAEGLYVAGYLAYEAGAAFEAAAPVRCDRPLCWFGLFPPPRLLDTGELGALLPDPAGSWIGAATPTIAQEDYAARLARVLDLIEAGDIYQANLTFAARADFAGDPLALYAALRTRARAGHGAIVSTGDQLLLSLSPELFFSLQERTLTTRPMKGTARRADDPRDDASAALALGEDAKQRAENLMIVDLMRNDISRIAMPGSVAVPALFAIESYPTVHQMVSTVTGELNPGLDAVDALATLFPCGSITGAPKIRAMQVIAEVEPAPRGAYTGAIGRIDADGDASFSVAIRTLRINPGERFATIGLGSGIVADSRADGEWDECLAKADFLTAGQLSFDLIETMGFDPVDGLLRIDAHLARMKASAMLFGFQFDRHSARNELQAATFALRVPSKVRLLVARSGAVAIESVPLEPLPDRPVGVAVVPLPVDASDFRLRHKTTDRAFYDLPRKAAGSFEVAFTDRQGFLTEGSFTSIFVPRGEMLVTPPVARGLLPGILRAALIDSGRAVEGDLTPADLEGGFFIGNAVRGLIAAELVA